MFGLSGKVALVTGSSRGIGAAIAKRLAREGASVIVNYAKNADAANEVVAFIKDFGGEAIAIQADLSDAAQVRNLFAKSLECYGKFHILVNNAGTAEFATIDKIDEKHVQQQFNLNVYALIQTCQEAVRLFDTNGGRIVNISSMVVRTPPLGATVYSATKAAVDTITRSLSAELASHKITVNAVAPGATDTELAQTVNTQESTQYILSRTPLGRLGQPDEIASVVAFLVSDDAAWVTGQIIAADGGFRF
ncbi:MAG: glucose 1-dehydrogenase [Hydrococcus sp. Prado102]|jgi:3-oxoacyl-[acyl-carrier protein] reductase|nr:glucose 1-dehydrogenase [Hydrococcus sp. Prado102]